MKKPRRKTITFQPDHVSRSLLAKAINNRAGRKADKRGYQTKLINEALHMHYAYLAGKREAA